MLPVNVPARVAEVAQKQWGEKLIKSWNEHGWFHFDSDIGRVEVLKCYQSRSKMALNPYARVMVRVKTSQLPKGEIGDNYVSAYGKRFWDAYDGAVAALRR